MRRRSEFRRQKTKSRILALSVSDGVRKMPQRRWLSVIVAVAANGVLFYVLALARTVPPSTTDAEYDIMPITSVDLPVISEIETDIANPSKDLVLAAPEEMPVVSTGSAFNITPSMLPRLSDWVGYISPDLAGLTLARPGPAGLALALPGGADLRSTGPATVSGLDGRLSLLKVDQIPLKTAGAPPRYPQWARQNALEAVVTLRFVVTARGAVQDIKVHDIEGDERFGDEAVHAVADWRFEPAIKGGKPVACWCFQKISFKLVD